MNKTSPKNYRQSHLASKVFCSLMFILLMISFTLPVSVQAAKSDQFPEVIFEDLDGDGLNDVSIETDLIRVVISSKTGEPLVYYLKGQNFEEHMYPPVLLDMGYNVATDTMQPFKASILNHQIDSFGYRVTVEEETSTTVVVRAIANIPGVSDSSEASAEELTGVAVSKVYSFSNGNYHFEIDYIVSNLNEHLISVGDDANGSLSLSYGPGVFMDPFGPSTLLGLQPLAVQKFTDATKFNAAVSAGGFNGVGIRDQYFCILIESAEVHSISAKTFKINAADESKKEHDGHIISMRLPKFNLGALEARSFAFKVYGGPVVLDELAKINRAQVTEYGFLSTLLLRILQFFYGLIPNFGLAIILMTLLVRLILYPLTLKQTKSMAQMQKIQPKVKELKERHKDNPQKFNEEVLKLYQKHNVNPLGGCLPLLLQLPILIALYNTIRIAVELRKTPFLWISDLSKGDPLLILPIAIAGLMYYQQGKMTDPQQQQMMAFMPMFMFVITWSLPAGLLVYWFTSTILGLIQQFQANRLSAAIKEESS